MDIIFHKKIPQLYTNSRQTFIALSFYNSELSNALKTT